jgi:adenylosuccinate synthase
MKTAQIVLGLQFGDEGKGRTVDYLSTTYPKSIVVRFSGGQNCGHTVIKDGIKHVFSNYGSGAMRNIPSYFSEHCCIYLYTIAQERVEMVNKGITPSLWVHPLAKMTTPYDVAYGRILERRYNHGSCGVGIGSTMKRHLNTGYKLFAIDLQSPNVFFAKMGLIKQYYRSLLVDDAEKVHFNIELDKFEGDFINLVKQDLFSISDYSLLNHYDNIIFEGSQGIMLDMDHGLFPNVTFANTTSKNAWEIINQLKVIPEVNTYYITRCYLTRHGNGWMPNETPIKLINNEEEINVLNPWQGQFRIGEIDYDLINYAITIDKQYNESPNHTLVVTCLDQRPGFEIDLRKICYRFDNKLYFQSPSNQIKSGEVVVGYY